MASRSGPSFSLGAALAILAAAGSFVASCGGHPFLGVALAVIALPLAALGMLSSMSSRIRGGFISIFALICAIAGIAWAIVVMAMKIVVFPL